jgi:hypothetical protein
MLTEGVAAAGDEIAARVGDSQDAARTWGEEDEGDVEASWARASRRHSIASQ